MQHQHQQQEILHLTSSACAYLNETLHGLDEEIPGFVLALKNTGCAGYSYDLAFADSHVDDSNTFVRTKVSGINFYVQTHFLVFFKGTTIDYQETSISSGIIIQNPNVRAACGCGASVSF